MRTALTRLLLTACIVAATTWPAHAQSPTFGELLAQAKAQAAAGHRWAPAGDNMTETVVNMMDLIPTATPQQLTELSALLESDQAHPPPLAPGSSAYDQRALGSSTPAPTSLPPSGPSAGEPRPLPPAALSDDTSKPPTEPLVPPTAPQSAPTGQQSSRPAEPSAPITQRQPDRTDPTAIPAVGPPPTRPAAPNTDTALLQPVRPPPPAADATLAIPDRLVPKPSPQVILRPGPRAMELYARGQQAERQGDVSGARRLYSSAAQHGHSGAARDLGRLYDPAYLSKTALGGIDPDPALARHWYERAIAMGDVQAGPLLEALSLR